MQMSRSELFRMLLLSGAIAFSGAGLSACNTTEGFGEDLEDAGEELQEEADDAKD